MSSNEEEGECACVPFILFVAHGKPTIVGGSNQEGTCDGPSCFITSLSAE